MSEYEDDNGFLPFTSFVPLIRSLEWFMMEMKAAYFLFRISYKLGKEHKLLCWFSRYFI